jgi:hypothetical protein
MRRGAIGQGAVSMAAADGLRLRNGMKLERNRQRFFVMPDLSYAVRESCAGSWGTLA